MRKAQGKQLKFDHRDQARDSRLWTFSNQVHDNIFWTLTSGIGVLTGYQVLILWAMANGWAPVVTFAENPVWFLLALILLPIWSAFHFYWVHRFLHMPFMYRRFHAFHHRNVDIGPWSGIAMHPVEHLLYHSTLLIHFVVPLHPIHLAFGVIYNGPGAAMPHTGYDNLLIHGWRSAPSTTSSITGISSATTAIRRCPGTAGSEPFTTAPRPRPDRSAPGRNRAWPATGHGDFFARAGWS